MFLSICGHAQTSSSDWLTFSQNGYKIKYPKTWVVDTTKHGVAELMLHVAPSNSDTSSIVHGTNINLITQDLGGESITLDQFASAALDQVKKVSDNVIIDEAKSVTTDKGQYYKVVFGFSKDGTSYKFEQRYLIQNGRVYIFTFTSDKDEFESYKATGEDILNSFSLK